MKVRELIEALEQFDQDLEVGFEHPSHDYWRSMLIGTVDLVEEGYAKYSDYHSQLGVASDDEIEEAEYFEADPDESAPEKSKRVTKMVILK
jgi:hypothetical protein